MSSKCTTSNIRVLKVQEAKEKQEIEKTIGNRE